MKVCLDATAIIIQGGSTKTSYEHLKIILRLGIVCLQKVLNPLEPTTPCVELHYGFILGRLQPKLVLMCLTMTKTSA
jgi:hypothetical protein